MAEHQGHCKALDAGSKLHRHRTLEQQGPVLWSVESRISVWMSLGFVFARGAVVVSQHCAKCKDLCRGLWYWVVVLSPLAPAKGRIKHTKAFLGNNFGMSN